MTTKPKPAPVPHINPLDYYLAMGSSGTRPAGGYGEK